MRSGNIPIFLDISEETLGITCDTVLASPVPLQALIAVHSHGIPCPILNIQKHCRKNGIFLIEDFALAQGGHVGGEPVGQFGNVSLTSFGAGKIISIDHGGAVLTNDQHLMREFQTLEKSFNAPTATGEARMEELVRLFRQLYNTHYLYNQPISLAPFHAVLEDTTLLPFFRFDLRNTDSLHHKLNNLPKILQIRERNAEFLWNKFQHRKGILLPPLIGGSTHWRFNLFLQSKRNQLLQSLLQQKFKVSSWYPSIDFFATTRDKIGSGKSLPTPNSNWVGDRILNLWVNEEIDDAYLEKISDDIIRTMDV
jgi:dTDP-4-amino-4,6-dideoxygalactose transaminase